MGVISWKEGLCLAAAVGFVALTGCGGGAASEVELISTPASSAAETMEPIIPVKFSSGVGPSVLAITNETGAVETFNIDVIELGLENFPGLTDRIQQIVITGSDGATYTEFMIGPETVNGSLNEAASGFIIRYDRTTDVALLPHWQTDLLVGGGRDQALVEFALAGLRKSCYPPLD